MKIIYLTLSLLVGIYFLIIISIYLFQRNLLYHPAENNYLEEKLLEHNIQKIVTDYYNIKLSDLLSNKRNRSLARPRQLSMSLAKELTTHSLPEIGDAFGGRDHTTVLHACKRISELRTVDNSIEEDYKKLLRAITA